MAARDRYGGLVLALQEGVAAGQARPRDHIDVIARDLSKAARRPHEKQSSAESRPASVQGSPLHTILRSIHWCAEIRPGRIIPQAAPLRKALCYSLDRKGEPWPPKSSCRRWVSRSP